MRKYFWWMICALMVVSSVTFISWGPVHESKPVIENNKTAPARALSAKEMFGQYVADVYSTAQLQQTGLDIAVLQKAITGYYNLKIAGKLPQNSNVITVIDFNKPSREKRMWIVDLATKAMLLHTWVSHGQGSGNDMATAFSNTEHSHQSSLGFYVTDDVYYGKHGRSLKLDGMDAGFNSNARARAVVVHAADYVSQGTINTLGRLGRSHGCPAVSPAVSDMVINTIKGKTMLFIAGKDNSYTSKYINEDAAALFLNPQAPVAEAPAALATI
ncbi:hypothetical protein DJ568_00125 [Mucilaginibacter hurinus]|uniref:Murein L,D-transpeptidase catalytic domain family protein n=1 Tax=Mucilaginibacter hurinus TaxID=2201324 RepID=A0A367GT13_9SPHI|nr:murein L,D-transpeptidase catalytic domain family protein [Mucilaginibacter hurinus]RCH56308.1 hypothetical protein DJ568_00125 [Mucilaginibacter hurinus]